VECWNSLKRLARTSENGNDTITVEPSTSTVNQVSQITSPDLDAKIFSIDTKINARFNTLMDRLDNLQPIPDLTYEHQIDPPIPTHESSGDVDPEPAIFHTFDETTTSPPTCSCDQFEVSSSSSTQWPPVDLSFPTCDPVIFSILDEPLGTLTNAVESPCESSPTPVLHESIQTMTPILSYSQDTPLYFESESHYEAYALAHRLDLFPISCDLEPEIPPCESPLDLASSCEIIDDSEVAPISVQPTEIALDTYVSSFPTLRVVQPTYDSSIPVFMLDSSLDSQSLFEPTVPSEYFGPPVSLSLPVSFLQNHGPLLTPPSPRRGRRSSHRKNKRPPFVPTLAPILEEDEIPEDIIPAHSHDTSYLSSSVSLPYCDFGHPNLGNGVPYISPYVAFGHPN